MKILDVDKLSMTFGGISALSDVSLTVSSGTVTALIGPNGAGKTTLFNCLTGFYKATSGAITYHTDNRSYDLIQLLGPQLSFKRILNPRLLIKDIYYKMFGGSHKVCQAGIARTFQNIRLFKDMTVIENLLVAQHGQLIKNPISGVFRTKRYTESEANALANAYEWLAVVDLEAHANRLAGELAYGLQRKLEIARAMCTNPRMICLDEPAAGLNPVETSSLKEIIKKLKTDYKTTVLIIEHDMPLVMDISDHIIVLDHGEVIADGTPAEIQQNKKVIAAYLGVEEDAA